MDRWLKSTVLLWAVCFSESASSTFIADLPSVSLMGYPMILTVLQLMLPTFLQGCVSCCEVSACLLLSGLNDFGGVCLPVKYSGSYHIRLSVARASGFIDACPQVLHIVIPTMWISRLVFLGDTPIMWITFSFVHKQEVARPLQR